MPLKMVEITERATRRGWFPLGALLIVLAGFGLGLGGGLLMARDGEGKVSSKPESGGSPPVVVSVTTSVAPVVVVPAPISPEPPPPPAPAPAPAAPTTYFVQPGDTLSTIAARFGTTVEVLVAANGITQPDIVVTGQRLVIP